ncbi:MAG TPA: succinate dehydrogenase cytochrome b subunit [Egibacteraceae bacterium]|nr:succinate dehydrogenase cytochrome b subunit [Actinomycetota bacterium]HWB72697.1 succinate dehydrogenase cytochrome b subunit [Egibacteraceae bacterium]
MSTTRRTPVEHGQQALQRAPTPSRRRLWLLELYRSALGKKYVMAVSGIVLMAYVLAHMVGNLKLYLGAEELNQYAEWLRDVGYPALPHSALLWTVRVVLLIAFVLHIHAAYALTVMNRRARPVGYQSSRDYVAASFAARTMRWTGVIVGLFVVFHLMDLTWGTANPQFVKADVYHNVVASFRRWPVALVYVVANVALGYHLFHGAWSLFQSLGWNQRRFNHWRRYFAVAFASVIVAGNVSFPLAVLAGIVA